MLYGPTGDDTMRRRILGLAGALALAASAGACTVAGERALGGAGFGAGIGAAAGGPTGAVVGAAAGAVVGAATTPAPLQPKFTYVETLPACPGWRHRTVRSSSDAFQCKDERGWLRPRRSLPLEPLPERDY
jgi:osmotically inducible lipoprotein OsmB